MANNNNNNQKMSPKSVSVSEAKEYVCAMGRIHHQLRLIHQLENDRVALLHEIACIADELKIPPHLASCLVDKQNINNTGANNDMLSGDSSSPFALEEMMKQLRETNGNKDGNGNLSAEMNVDELYDLVNEMTRKAKPIDDLVLQLFDNGTLTPQQLEQIAATKNDVGQQAADHELLHYLNQISMEDVNVLFADPGFRQLQCQYDTMTSMRSVGEGEPDTFERALQVLRDRHKKVLLKTINACQTACPFGINVTK